MFLRSNWIALAILPFFINTAAAAALISADMPTVQIISQSSKMCMDIPNNSQTNGAVVAQTSCSSTSPTEIWKIVSITPTQYQIVSNNTGMCLDLDGASSAAGANLQQSACAGINRKNQIWNFVVLNGGYQIISASSGLCLDLSATTQGAPLQQSVCNNAGQASQTWSVAAVTPSSLVSSAPLTITKSNTVVNGVQISNPSGPCIIISGAAGNVSNVTISNSNIGPCNSSGSNVGNGVLIQSPSGQGNVTNVVINNVNFHDLQGSGVSLVSGFTASQSVGNVLSVANSLFTNIKQFGIYVSFVKPAATDTVPSVPALSFTNNKLQNIPNQGFLIYGTNSAFVENNTFTLTLSGVTAQNSMGVRVNNNSFFHLKPSTVNGNLVFGTFVQFNNVTSVNNSISCNIGLQDAYNTVPQSTDGVSDEISVYESSGTAESPLLVVGNKLMGGGELQATSGDEGSGITVGDGSGGSYINVIDNVLVNVGHGGLMGAGGTNIQFLNNQIFSVPNPVNFFGLGFVNYAPLYNGGACSNITVENNLVNWTNLSGPDTTGWINPLITGSTVCTNFTWTNNVFQDPAVTAALYTTYQPSECPMV